MSVARLTPFLAVALVLTIVPSAVHARPPRKPTGPPGPVQAAPLRVVVGEQVSGTPGCDLGQPGTGGDTLNFIYPPDEYFVRLTPTSCAECPSANTIQFSHVQLSLYFPVACVFPVTVAVVGATGPADCPKPDAANVLYLGGAFDLTGEAGSMMNFDIELRDTCRFTGEVFLRVGFPVRGTACATYALQPRAVLAHGTCGSCLTYNDIDIDELDPEPLEDMCTPDRIGNSVMSVTIDRCFDTLAPGAIADVQSDSVSASAVRLLWTATGDDGAAGTATSYELRVATFPLDENNFTSGDSIASLPAPATSGTSQRFLVTGLANTQLYYFALRAIDEDGNRGPLSNPLSVTTGAAPGQVVDLAAIGVSESSVTLRWTAPGSTAEAGLPEVYLVHAATAPITATSFDAAPYAREVPAVVATGQREVYRFEGLEPSRRYWFGLRARDAQGNLSPLSNVPARWTTAGGPLTGLGGVALACRYTPARVPVQLLWQAASEQVGNDQVIRIYDMNGRWVRNLYPGPQFTGATTWDGRDYKGNDVPPGLYFARYITGGVRADARIVLIR